MSSNFPPVLPKEGHPMRVDGPTRSTVETPCETARSHSRWKHPLEDSERNYVRNLEELNLQMLRNLQGVHAPFRLGMERALASKVGRLAPLQSSNVMLNVVMGLDEVLGFQDALGGCEYPEVAEKSCSDRFLLQASGKT
ncbi:proteasome maturation protein-like [Corticium candelabrum]|uniref:proteasome maturation protein-like n=1 Tax=Corticium candelabrum TaxID=121492 RepID=UPI002E26BB79|nr:proteasome maturation protein-like [Corticium candelabrum]